jgi:hypothetical protein
MTKEGLVTEHPVKPERITKPIQLLAAWLAGLLAIDSCFLFAATRMPDSSWHASALVLAAILNVPLFLVAVFLLQTRFRPELQEDAYYSTYLSAKTNQLVKVPLSDSKIASIHEQFAVLESRLSRQPIKSIAAVAGPDLSSLTFGINHHLEDRKHIQKKLAELNILGSRIFGDDVVEPPNGRNISMAMRLPQEYVRSIVALASKLGFDTYSFIAPEEEIDEDVLIGSYGKPEFDINR